MSKNINKTLFSRKDWRLLPDSIKDKAEALLKRCKDVFIGKSITYGFFILSKDSKDRIKTEWIQKNKVFAPVLIERLTGEISERTYTKEVNQQIVRKGTPGETIKPRLYLDKFLDDAGFNPGDMVEVTVNFSKSTVVVKKIHNA